MEVEAQGTLLDSNPYRVESKGTTVHFGAWHSVFTRCAPTVALLKVNEGVCGHTPQVFVDMIDNGEARLQPRL